MFFFRLLSMTSRVSQDQTIFQDELPRWCPNKICNPAFSVIEVPSLWWFVPESCDFYQMWTYVLPCMCVWECMWLSCSLPLGPNVIPFDRCCGKSSSSRPAGRYGDILQTWTDKVRYCTHISFLQCLFHESKYSLFTVVNCLKEYIN